MQNFDKIRLYLKASSNQEWAVVPGQGRDPGPENPQDWDGDWKPQDSRDRDENLRDSPGTLAHHTLGIIH